MEINWIKTERLTDSDIKMGYSDYSYFCTVGREYRIHKHGNDNWWLRVHSTNKDGDSTDQIYERAYMTFDEVESQIRIFEKNR